MIVLFCYNKFFKSFIKMKTRTLLITAIFCGISMIYAFAQSATLQTKIPTKTYEQKKAAKEMISSYVNDFKNDSYANEKRIVGVEIPECNGQWTITVTGAKQNDTWEVTLAEGLPTIPTYVYRIEFSTLEAIFKGEINALTAQGKAFSSDYTPMSVYEINDYKPSLEEDGKLNSFSFHFWTRGFPEVIPFRPDTTRKAHGSNFTIFYYEKGLRTAWYNILPGERVRDDAKEQAMPFPMMGITIKGTIEGEVDGKRITVSEGNTVFIPPNVQHKWWNDSEEPVEVILIMFGKGA
jgi:mannose-6-phosphate isomerase-like protein (cupin superfamily)